MRYALLLIAAAAFGEEARPLPLRDRVPADATLCLRWSAELDGLEDLHLRGKELEVRHVKLGRPKNVRHEIVRRLPRRELGIFVKLVEGRGYARVLQDPSRKNGYEAIVRIVDKGKGSAPAVLEVYYGRRPPPPPPFPVELAEGPAPKWNRRPLSRGRFFGERPGAARKLARGEPLFRWRGEVTEYAVLAIGDAGVELLDCGIAGARTAQAVGRGGDGFVVLSRCEGPGRVRVLQRMHAPAAERVLIEIDDRDVAGKSAYEIVGHSIPAAVVEALYGPAGGDEAAWMKRALATRDETARLWAIEKVCMLRRFPAADLNVRERATLTVLSRQERVAALRGRNVILAWPPAFVERLPTCWRFLAEVDVAMDWLRHWTGIDQVTARGKRMISRFRVDDGGTALYVDFRLHIPRVEMQVPPHHGPYSHEVSHGFIVFPAICPTGRYNEGLTEVSRTAYWWFLGHRDAWEPFQRRCLLALRDHYERGGTLADVPSYATAAAVYLTLLRRTCTHADGDPDWERFALLLRAATRAERGTGFPRLLDVCERAFGKECRRTLETLRVPRDG